MKSMMKTLGVFSWIFVLSLGVTCAQSAMTEADAVAMFVDASPRARLAVLRGAEVEAAIRAETALPNPVISYEVEDAGDSRDEFLVVEQDVPWNGQRGLRRKGASLASDAAQLEVVAHRRHAVHDVRVAFYEVVRAERQRELIDAGAEQLAGLVQILRERELSGEGSGYDVLRAEQELANVRLQLASVDGERAAAVSALGALLDLGPDARPIRVKTALDLRRELVSAASAEALALSERADLRALSARSEHLELEQRAGRRTRIPEPTFRAGFKRVESAGLADEGFVASVSIPLPVLDRGQFRSARAAAAREAVATERLILERQIVAEVRSAHARAAASRLAATEFAAPLTIGRDEISRIARLAYDEGEQGILELIDAYRIALEAKLRAVDLVHKAKRAEIELERTMGQEPQP